MKRLFGLVLITSFVVVACNRAPAEPPAPAVPAPKPYAPLAHVMQGITFPASNIIFDTQSTDPAAEVKEGDPNAAGATAQFSGVYGGWLAVENAARAIQESANLLLIPGRTCLNGKPVPTDQADFQKWAEELAAAGEVALKGAQSKNMDAMLDVSDKLTVACANCHEKYRDTPKAPDDRCTP